MGKIFISHSSKDKEIIEAFVDLLVSGLSISRDEIFCTSLSGSGIITGKNWRDSIKSHLTQAEIIFLVVTPNYKESEICLNEMGAALMSDNDNVIPIIMDPITFQSAGPLLEPLQIEKLLEEESLDNIKDLLVKQFDILPKKAKTAVWTNEKKKFLIKCKVGPVIKPVSKPGSPDKPVNNPNDDVNEAGKDDKIKKSLGSKYMFGLHYVFYINPKSKKKERVLSYQFYEIDPDNTSRMVDAIGKLKFDNKIGHLINSKELKYFESEIHIHKKLQVNVGEVLHLELESEAGHFKEENYWRKSGNIWKGVIYGQDHDGNDLVEAILTKEWDVSDKRLKDFDPQKIITREKGLIDDNPWISEKLIHDFWPSPIDLNNWRKTLNLKPYKRF